MNLYTHVLFGMAIAAVFSGSLQIILLVAIGSLIPDLDRLYLFFRKDKFKEEQLHRSLLHNVFVLFVIYLVNSWLAFGAFLHTVLDAFTTEEDRGVEWLFPLTRLATRGKYTYYCTPNDEKCIAAIEGQDLGQEVRTYFLNEDSAEFTKLSDPDLQIPGKQVPWRRTYGPAKNGGLLDTSIFYGSLVYFLLYFFLHLRSFIDELPQIMSSTLCLYYLLLLAVVLLYLGGYFQIKVNNSSLYKSFTSVGIASLILAVLFAIENLTKHGLEIGTYSENILVLGTTMGLATIMVWLVKTRKGRQIIV